MVNWVDAWMEKTDASNIKVGLWAKKKNKEYTFCLLCSADVKFSKQGFQSLVQHSKYTKHHQLSDSRFASNVRRFVVNKTKPSCSASATSRAVVVSCSTNITAGAMAAKTVGLDNTLDNKVTAAEAMWLFKVAEKDLSLRDCNHMPQLFQNMFPDSKISQKFSMSKDKASYVFQYGLPPLLGEKICQAVHRNLKVLLHLAQVKKQMDLLLTYWDEDAEEVVAKYLDSLFFGRAAAVNIVNIFCKIHDGDEFHDFPWEKLFNISSDGPNIHKAIW